jgi:D-arginine dehydrogenase
MPSLPSESAEVLVVGAGIAGTSAAYFIAPHRDTLVLEREDQPGYHSTGRSAAQFIATYGPPQVRALTRASRAFFERPPAGFADVPLLHRRAVMTLGLEGQESALDAAWAVLASVDPSGRRLTPAQAQAIVPTLRTDRLIGALLEPDAFDIDVHALHQGFLRGLRAHGGRVRTDAEVAALTHVDGRWHATLRDGAVVAAACVVDAAGAWGDVLARQAGVAPLGLEPRRRSAFVFDPPAGVDIAGWPLVVDAGHRFYFKPDAGRLLASPANEDPTFPQDVQPEALDVALGIDRIEAHTTLVVGRPRRTWAGLRSFVADGDLVAGFDAAAPGFFWCVGQGGYGIQTAPAMGQAVASLVLGRALPASLVRAGVSAAALSPHRPGLAARTGAP